ISRLLVFWGLPVMRIYRQAALFDFRHLSYSWLSFALSVTALGCSPSDVVSSASDEMKQPSVPASASLATHERRDTGASDSIETTSAQTSTTQSYDFGILRPHTTASHNCPVTNTSSKTQKLESVVSSCTCSVVRA